jgi:SAM-dependent methyltransferase
LKIGLTKITLWPKRIPELTEEQEWIREDFYSVWLALLPKKYGLLERFNHRYPLRTMHSGVRTLEIGAGVGGHLAFEDLVDQEYVVIELRADFAQQMQLTYPGVEAVVGDCQVEIPFGDDSFDRVLAVHVLEHMPNLPAGLDEIQRVLKPGGEFSVVIPCEGGWAYTLARNISARRIFERRYKQSYDWFVACEHVNRPAEILDELLSRFRLKHRSFFPMLLPVVNLNLVIGLTFANGDPSLA